MTDSYTSLFKEQLENTEILNLQINKELYYLIDNLILIDAQEKAQLLLNIVARKQTFPIYFLNTITNYLQKNNKKENLKRYIKYISKSIQKIEKTFDEEYLLLKNENKFHLEENLIFLNFVDSLSEILNLYDFNKYADKLFILKNKNMILF